MKKFSKYFLIIFFLTSFNIVLVGEVLGGCYDTCGPDDNSAGWVDCMDNCQLNSPDGTGASSVGGILKGIKCAGDTGEPCGLCDFILVFKNISDMILAASGVVGFLLFIYAGILYLLVPYKPDYVTKAKTMITSVIIGMVIVFGAYTVVSFTLKTIGYGGAWSVCSESPSPTN